MLCKSAATLTILAGMAVGSTPAAAMGNIGCNNLPEYYRAVGTIENGPYSCGMSMEEARRILARGENGEGVAPQPAAPPAPRRHHRRRTTPRM